MLYPVVAAAAIGAGVYADEGPPVWSVEILVVNLANWRVRSIAIILNMAVIDIARIKMSQNACRMAKLRARLLFDDPTLVGKLLVNPGELLLVVLFTKVGSVGLEPCGI